MATPKRLEEMTQRIAHSLMSHVDVTIGSQKEPTLITLGSNAVWCIAQKYTQDEFRQIKRELLADFDSVAPVFYQDGKKYFRLADSLQKKESLRHYPTELINRGHLLSHPERIQVQNTGSIQYFRPKQNLVVTYSFIPFRFDYSHISGDKFRPPNSDSKEFFYWKSRHIEIGKLNIQQNQLLGSEQLIVSPKKRFQTVLEEYADEQDMLYTLAQERDELRLKRKMHENEGLDPHYHDL